MQPLRWRSNARTRDNPTSSPSLKGFPSQSTTFERKTDAKEWAKQTKACIREGRYFKTAEAKKHTIADFIDRYPRETEKKNPKHFVLSSNSTASFHLAVPAL
jgi:hypothetical protein